MIITFFRGRHLRSRYGSLHVAAPIPLDFCRSHSRNFVLSLHFSHGGQAVPVTGASTRTLHRKALSFVLFELLLICGFSDKGLTLLRGIRDGEGQPLHTITPFYVQLRSLCPAILGYEPRLGPSPLRDCPCLPNTCFGVANFL